MVLVHDVPISGEFDIPFKHILSSLTLLKFKKFISRQTIASTRRGGGS